MLPQEHQQKFDLLLHLIRNSAQPIALIGSETEQALFKAQLEQETSKFQSISIFQADEQTGPPQLMGLLFHQLGISEREVRDSEPEVLLARYLGALEKKHQLLLVVIEKADNLDRQQLPQLLALVQSYSALRLLFIPNKADAGKWIEKRLYPFFVSQPERVPTTDKTTKTILRFGGLLSLLLLILIGTIWLPQEPEQSENHASLDRKTDQQPLTATPPAPDLLSKEHTTNTVKTSDAIITLLEKTAPSNEPLKTTQPDEQANKLVDAPVTEELITPNNNEPPTTLVEAKKEIPLKKQTQSEGVETKTPLTITDKTKKNPERITATFLPATKPVKSTPAPVLAIHQESWLLKQPFEKFSLQIISGGEEKSVIQYIKSQKTPGQFAYYRSTRKGKPWFPVLYGVYPSKEAAKKAAKKLPPALLKFKPWARSLESIQKEIRAN